MTRPVALEIAVQDPTGVRIAGAIGAARVELAQALPLGGLTPSPATLDLSIDAARAVGVEVHVLVRPRAGGFRYTADEIMIAESDVRRAIEAGADGVVIGALNDEGLLDIPAMRRLRDAADGASVTLHRAIDVTPDPVATLVAARDLGLHRVLTSGGASVAIDGIDTLRALVAEAAGEIEIMAGSGVDAASAAALVAVGVDALHFSAKRTVLEDGGVRMGSASDGVGGYEVTDLEIAQGVVAALSS